MSFADYLRERISNDYKNLIIRKLEEIRLQTEQLKDQFTPSFESNQQRLRQAVHNEFVRIQELLDREFLDSQDRISSDFRKLIDEHIANWYEADVSPFEQQLEVLLSDILSNIPSPPKKKSSEIESLAALMRKLDQQGTQSEILNTLLMHIAGWLDRAVLFVVKGDSASGWAALGLDPDWNTERVRSIRIDLNKETILNEVLATGESCFGPSEKYADHGEIYRALGTKVPLAAAASPIKVRGKIAGILYADFDHGLEETPDFPELLFLSTRATGFAIDLLPLKPKTVPPGVQARAVPDAVRVPPVEVEVQAETESEQEVEAQVEQESAEQESEEQIEASAPSSPEITAPVPSVQEVEEMPEEEAEEGTVIMPAIAAPPVVSEEEQKLHDDAKRFARLLVSEIKLYNEAQVAAGREHRDLYERLREDIERSRRMYQERVPTQIHSSTNYFYEELVRTLANGDPTLLGM
jgi:hypothetical protein